MKRENVDATRAPLAWCNYLCAIVAIVAVGVVLWADFTNSPGWDETGHLASGIDHWQTGSFRAYHVNPPLPRLFQTLFVEKPDFEKPRFASGGRFEWPLAKALIEEEGRNIFQMLSVARLINIPLLLLLAWAASRWAGELWGRGLPSRAAWCLVLVDPTNLAAASLVTPDIFAAISGLFASYTCWRYSRKPTHGAAFATGLTCGLAVSCKFTWIAVALLWFAYCLVFAWRKRQWNSLIDALLAAVTAWFIVCLTYGFQGVGRPIGSYAFVSVSLTQEWFQSLQFGTLSWLPVPLPNWMVNGIDLQKADFDRGVYSSYFAGSHHDSGDYRFYIVSMLLKWPIPWLLCLMPSLVWAISRLQIRDCVVWVVPTFLFVSISSFTGFTHHFRYVGPATPFLAVTVVGLLTHHAAVIRKIVCVCLIAGSCQSLLQAPDFLKFDNGCSVVAGGEGLLFGRSMFDSTVDWGQDLLRLRSWLDENPHVQLRGLQHNSMPGLVAALNLPETLPPKSLPPACFHPASTTPCQVAGWYALNAKGLYSADEHWSDFQLIEPYAVIGGTIFVYRIE